MVSAPYAARSSPSRQSMSASEERGHLPECSHGLADGRHEETRPYAASSLSTGGMSCDAVTSSRATQLASTHGRWTVESQLACRVRRVGQRRMRDHEARISAPRRGAIATTWFTPDEPGSKVTETGLNFVHGLQCCMPMCATTRSTSVTSSGTHRLLRAVRARYIYFSAKNTPACTGDNSRQGHPRLISR